MTSHPPDGPHATRTRLLEAALILFAEKGLDGTGIREIAAKAQANSAMVQYHFGGKEGLYREVLRYTFEQGPTWVHALPPVPAPDAPEAHDGARACLRTYLRAFLQDLLFGPGPHCGLSAELDRAANLLWNREMQYPLPEMEAFIGEAVRPFSDYLRAIMLVLRPDLDAESRLRMEISIQAQIMWMHSHLGLTRILRGSAYTEADTDSLTEHFYTFCLGGLGLPEGQPKQGDRPCR